MATLRSSNRATPRKKYTNDPFEGIEALESSSSGSESEDDAGDEDHEDDDGDAQSEEEDSDVGEIISNDEWDEDEVDDVPDDLLTSDAVMRDKPKAKPRHPGSGRPRTTGPGRRKKGLAPKDYAAVKTANAKARVAKAETNSKGEVLYTRGLAEDVHRRMLPERQRMHVYGPTEEDWGPVQKAHDRWQERIGLPARAKPDTPNLGGFTYTEALEKEIENSEMNWEWYSREGGKEAFSSRQMIEHLSSREAAEYLPIEGTGERAFVTGAPGRYKLHTLRSRGHVTLSDPNNEAQPENATPASTSNGFVVNLGARVRCLDWAFNQSGHQQYLAVSATPLSRAEKGSSAFTPQTGKSNIQLWQFGVGTDGSIDTGTPAWLNRVLCLEVGDIKVLKWCPVPANIPSRLGLLAFISGDGALRVVDLEAYDFITAEPINIHITQFAFEAKPPDTVCTSLTWISSRRIAATCANGFLAVWDLPTSFNSLPSTTPRPSIYTALSTTYLADLTSCYPSYPHFLISTSVSGSLLLTDISQPSHPVSSAISPLAPPTAIWHDQSHSALNVDDNTAISVHPLRRWFNSFDVGKVYAQATALAASSCHPFVLLGSVNGDVVGTNPLRRLFGGQQTLIYQQCWFSHDWRQANENELQPPPQTEENSPLAPATSDSATNAIIAKNGLTRMVDGLAVRVEPMKQYDFSPAKNLGAQSVFEMRSAITALAWNPNLKCGGWAAAGMGDGLLRVEDVSIRS